MLVHFPSLKIEKAGKTNCWIGINMVKLSETEGVFMIDEYFTLIIIFHEGYCRQGGREHFCCR